MHASYLTSGFGYWLAEWSSSLSHTKVGQVIQLRTSKNPNQGGTWVAQAVNQDLWWIILNKSYGQSIYIEESFMMAPLYQSNFFNYVFNSEIWFKSIDDMKLY